MSDEEKTGKVIELKAVTGGKDDPVEPLINGSVVSLLEGMLEMAKAGEIHHLAAIGRMPSGMLVFRMSTPTDEIQFIGMLEAAKLSVAQGMQARRSR